MGIIQKNMEDMKRIQRKRKKGFKLPTKTKCVNRGTKWGNPYKVVKTDLGFCVEKGKSTELYGYQFTLWPCDSQKEAHKLSIQKYAPYIRRKVKKGELNPNELVGKNLACFCSLELPCHADWLLNSLESLCKIYNTQ